MQTAQRSALLLLALLASPPLYAQDAASYPIKSVRVIVPFPAGGGLDYVARLVGQRLGSELKQTFVMENRPGAGGNIGTEIVAKAPADGYTLLIVSNSFAINPSLYKKIPYDPVKDFEPVSLLTSYMMYLVCHPSVPVRDLKSLMSLARNKPEFFQYASAGAGTTTHMAGELFASMTGLKMTHVPYRGTAPSLTALMGGEVALSFGSAASVPHIKTGRMVLIAVSGKNRSPHFPNVPTIAEAGVPGYEASGWNAVFAPSGTPAAIVKRLNEATVKGLKHSDAVKVIERQDLELEASSPEGLAQKVQIDYTKWSKIIKSAGIEQH